MPAHTESIELGVAIAQAADDIKASDLALYDVADILGVVDVFVVVSAQSDRQLDAVVDRIEQSLARDRDRRPLRREGVPTSGWMLLDYGEVVAHAFRVEERAHYDLDRLFSDAAKHDALTGDLVREMVPGAADRGDTEDVWLGVPGMVPPDEDDDPVDVPDGDGPEQGAAS